MDTLFIPKDSSSTTDYVINQIKDLLIAGKLHCGDRLPSEFELAKSFGVSRGSIRSAMKVFEVCGVVDIRRGDGTYIRSSLNPKRFNPLVLSLAIMDPGIYELTKFREKIELDIVELIINDAALSQEILPKLSKNLEELSALQSQESSVDTLASNDTAFHMLLASGCGNIVFETVYGYILDFFYPLILDTHREQIKGVVAAEDHRRIYDAIACGSYSMAKDAIIDSMKSLYNFLQNSCIN